VKKSPLPAGVIDTKEITGGRIDHKSQQGIGIHPIHCSNSPAALRGMLVILILYPPGTSGSPLPLSDLR
jgi:hypothetical protein